MNAMYYNQDRAKALMEEAGVDALISGAQENLSYFAGVPTLHGCMADLVMYVVVARDRIERPILIAPINAVDLYVQMGSWVDEVRLWGKFFIYQNDDPALTITSDERRMKQLLADGTVADKVGPALQHVITELKLLEGRLAIDERGLIDPPMYSIFGELFPRAEIVPGRQLARNIRAVKTPYEIALMREAARINDLGVRTILDAAKPGMSEKQLHRIYLDTIECEGAHSHHACIQSGTRGGLPNGEPSEKILERGEIMRLDFDLVFNGYYSDIARCAVVGRPSSRQVQYANAVIAGLDACKSAMRPGITAADVFGTGVDAVRSAGIPHYDRHHVGHGIGRVCYDEPLLSASNGMVLEENMVINIETPYYELGWGSAHVEETMLITHDGCECLYTLPLAMKFV
jgi:Xaa-Pro aminopeptidase